MGNSAAWASLAWELDRWADREISATFWWRDDDACAETPQLHRLDALSQKLQLPVSIAVIPSRLDPSLVTYVRGRTNITVLQHGYAHTSHAAPGVKKIEIGGVRDTDTIVDELATGLLTLRGSFSENLMNVLVPPWNRVESRVFSALARADFIGLSSMWARKQTFPAPELLQVNTHLDPVNWRFGGQFLGEYRAISQLRRHLYARRIGLREIDEPTGILTHHLVQDDNVWEFTDALFRFIKQHPASKWLSAKDIWCSD